MIETTRCHYNYIWREILYPVNTYLVLTTSKELKVLIFDKAGSLETLIIEGRTWTVRGGSCQNLGAL